jgi:hypothetical protein
MKTICLDIDDLLTTMDLRDIRGEDDSGKSSFEPDPLHHATDRFFTLSFEYNDRQYEVDYYLVPGSIEFLASLLAHDDVRPAFFSAGVHSRNLAMGKKLMEMVVAGKGGDPAWMDRYLVYSREDAFDTERFHDFDASKLFQPELLAFRGNYKKDLRVVEMGRERYRELFSDTLIAHWEYSKDKDNQNKEFIAPLLPDKGKDAPLLAEVLLIEEDPSYMFRGQEKNMLKCPTFRSQPDIICHNKEEISINSEGHWRALQDFQNINTLFYGAGLLDHVLNCAKTENLPLPEILWREQVEKHDIVIKGERVTWNYPMEYFLRGRDILRRYTPQMNFAVQKKSKP